MPETVDYTYSYSNFRLNAYEYENGSEAVLTGLVDITHYHTMPGELPVNSQAYFTIKLYDSDDNHVKSNAGSAEVIGVLPDTYVIQDDVGANEEWFIWLGDLEPGTYYAVISKNTDPDIRLTSPTFTITEAPSTDAFIVSFGFFRGDADNADNWPSTLPETIWGMVNPNLNRVDFSYSSLLTGITNLVPRIVISEGATILPLASSAQDFSENVIYTVTAESLYERGWVVIGTAVLAAEAFLFIYDNNFTRVAPEQVRPSQTINWFCLMSNSGQIDSTGNEVLTVSISDGANYYQEIYQSTVSVLAPYQDKEVTGSWQLPPNIPIGSTIPYKISFHLNSSLIHRSLVISSWVHDAKGIVFNRYIGAFIRETFSKSMFFAKINKDFYSLSIVPGSNDFFYHTDDIEDGQVRLYNQEFYPSVTFVVNKAKVEKTYDNIIMHMDSVGVYKIEYWTETQYSIHVWPSDPLLQEQARPWIDPEFRENKWYLPVHNEEILSYDYTADGVQASGITVAVLNPIPTNMRAEGILHINGEEFNYIAIDYIQNSFTLDRITGFEITDGMQVLGVPGDFAETREMRGTWMKIKITFRPLKKFTLKHVITEFRESLI